MPYSQKSHVKPTVKVNCIQGGRFCGLCCRETDMVLTVEDILEITSLGYSIDYFAELRDGYVRLRNVNGHCVFLDEKQNKCMIYSHRPIGCRLYPLLYDPYNDEVLVDDLCPRSHEVLEKVSLDEYKHVLRKIVYRARDAVILYNSITSKRDWYSRS